MCGVVFFCCKQKKDTPGHLSEPPMPPAITTPGRSEAHAEGAEEGLHRQAATRVVGGWLVVVGR